jgi:hypothetical protein
MLFKRMMISRNKILNQKALKMMQGNGVEVPESVSY